MSLFLRAFPLLTSSCCLITIPWYFCGFMQFGFLIDSKLCGLRANTRNSVLFRSREPNLEPLTKQRLYLLRPSVFKKDCIITNITSTIILTELSWQWWSCNNPPHHHNSVFQLLSMNGLAVASHPLQIVGGEQETEMLNVRTKAHDKDRANNKWKAKEVKLCK